MAREGAHLGNAFVTTSLCSPSRASILTGQYAHRHQIVDNTSPIPPGTVFFPERLAGEELLYEYYWEYAFPHTPTVFALRDARFKYITYHGVWDTDELYDLQEDPAERRTSSACRSSAPGPTR
jgi:hypothetical protein